MLIQLKVFRFQPEEHPKPYYDTYELEVNESDRILDVLEQVRGYIDSTLSFRRSCAHGVCGSDAMRINGQNALACKVLIKDLGTDLVVLEPLLGLRVIKDLIVDMEPFFEHYRSVMPFLVSPEIPPVSGRERLQSVEERERFDDSTQCILCGACTTACPVYWADGKYFGPAAFVSAYRFIFDSRDRGAIKRLGLLNGENGIWRCRTVLNCTETCPRGIQVARLIAEIKKAIRSGNLD